MTHPRRFSPYNWQRKHTCPDCGVEHTNRSGVANRCPECSAKHRADSKPKVNLRYYYRRKGKKVIQEVMGA